MCVRVLVKTKIFEWKMKFYTVESILFSISNISNEYTTILFGLYLFILTSMWIWIEFEKSIIRSRVNLHIISNRDEKSKIHDYSVLSSNKEETSQSQS